MTSSLSWDFIFSTLKRDKEAQQQQQKRSFHRNTQQNSSFLSHSLILCLSLSLSNNRCRLFAHDTTFFSFLFRWHLSYCCLFRNFFRFFITGLGFSSFTTTSSSSIIFWLCIWISKKDKMSTSCENYESNIRNERENEWKVVFWTRRLL